MKFLRVFFILFIVVAPSCISYRYIDIQVLEPGSTKLPSGVTLHFIEPQKLDSNLVNIVSDSLLFNQIAFNWLIHNFDSTLKKHFEASPNFEGSKVVIQDGKSYSAEMKSKSIDQQRTNILLAFRKLKVHKLRTYIAINRDDEGEYMTMHKTYLYNVNIEIVNVATDQIYDKYVDKDTLTWSTNLDFDTLSSRLPNTYQSVGEIGKIIADKYADRIAPVWESEERMLYFNNNKYLRRGYNKFLNDDLPGAITDWKHLYEVGTPGLASIAAHNIAVIYEIQDNLENCKTWLIYSLSNKKRIFTQDYFKRILERQAALEKVDKQNQLH